MSTLFSVTAFAEGICKLSVQSNDSSSEIKLVLENADGIYGGSCVMVYDNSAIEIVETKTSQALENSLAIVNKSYAENKVKLTWASATAITYNEPIISIEFKVVDKAASQAEFSIDEVTLYDADSNEVFCETTNITLNLPDKGIDTPYIPEGSVASGSAGGGGSISSYTVSFETNGGSVIKDVEVKKDKLLQLPETPIKDGYIFSGWFTDKELSDAYDIDAKVTKGFTLYAKWQEEDIEKPSASDPFSFADVKETDWYYEAVKFAYEKGITSGVSQTAYAPNNRVTRGQFITMLCRAYGIKEMTGDNFADCGDTWYTGYLAAAKQLGISNGVGDNKFAPEKEISREEMVTLIYNYLKSVGEVTEEISETSFSDNASISSWARNGVAFASSKGYINGKGDNLFDPNGDATRAELAQIFFNMFK